MLKAPGLFLKGDMQLTYDNLPLRMRNVSSKKRVNLLLCALDVWLRLERPFSLPPVVQIEPTNTCNLQCPLCPTGANTIKRSKGVMPLEMFSRIIDDLYQTLMYVILYGWGEPFLNSQITEMIRMCSEKGLYTVTSTNGHCIRDLHDALRVVDSRLTGLIIAFDGSSQEVYSAYRRNGDLNQVIHCARLIEKAKIIRKAEVPVTNLRVVLSNENKHQLSSMKRLAGSIGVDMFSIKQSDNLIQGQKQGNLRSSSQEGGLIQNHCWRKCPLPFRQPTIFWDGSVVGCEYDYNLEKPLGNLGDLSFREIWFGRQAREFRREVKRKNKHLFFCQSCPFQSGRHETRSVEKIEGEE